MPRQEWSVLRENYLTARKGHKNFNYKSSVARLPSEYHNAPIGITEIDLLDVIYNMDRCRVALVEGWRGSGKTSLLHYLEEVIHQCSPESKIRFLIIDGLQLADLRGPNVEKEVAEDYGRAIRSSVNKAIQQAIGRGSSPREVTALKRASRVLSTDVSQPAIRDSFVALEQNLLSQKEAKYVVVFDNLDHLSRDYWKAAVNFGRQITTSTNFRCFICVRPNVTDELFKGGDARAFFQHRIIVPAPDVELWINHLGKRLSLELEILAAENRSPPVLNGKEIRGNQIKTIFKNLADLLVNKRATKSGGLQDDVSAILEAIAADDTRHLQLLFRRIIRDSRLPEKFLLGQSETYEFHPISCLIDGGAYIYTHDRYVPNILVFDNGSGNPNFLIQHRILILLEPAVFTTVAELCRCLNLMGYDRYMVLQALEMLSGPLLIRANSGDTISASDPPEKVELTQAGYFYRQHFLRNADYLTAVVLDVPLQHETLRSLVDISLEKVRGGRRYFSARIASLIEYAHEVSKREERQIFVQLTTASASPELLRLADALRNGGLLTRSIMMALTAVHGRSQMSLNQAILSSIETALTELGDHCDRIEKRLDELVNRVRRAPTGIQQDLLPQSESGDFNIKLRDRGENLEAVADIPASRTDSAVVVSLEAVSGEHKIRMSTVAVPIGKYENNSGQPKASHRAIMVFPRLPGFAGEVLTKVSGIEIHHPVSETLFISPNINGATMQLLLHRLANGRKGEPIGPEVNLEEIESLSKELIQDINSRAGAGPLDLRWIREAGAELATKVLDNRGANYLCSLLKSSSLILLHSPMNSFLAPWEWLCPIPQADEETEPLAHGRMVVRWIGAPFDAANSLHHAKAHRQMKSMVTIGLPNSADRPWRVRTPSTPEDLADISSSADVLHIVGHWNDKEKVVEIGEGSDKLQINNKTIKAYNIGSKHGSLILSVCKLGNLKSASNLAMTAVDTRSAAVWTPITTIREADADELDQDLHDYVENQNDKSEHAPKRLGLFFLHRRKRNPWTHVYVRYGL
ncbi:MULTISPECIES: hypothetical protein [Roseomonadaceae]|uniref:AAA+ ATPase domain-containing protein n=1 Tax=Falsiroseomonas oleicola TaxID=2801474 RepID=A0ABS6HBL2_9PROT|nr:hypothetical protein [Roseomonas oleicola]MBU8546094.1 hypothetical protein [Roseomonas oleicola]